MMIQRTGLGSVRGSRRTERLAMESGRLWAEATV
jgi:hypothetical protein